MISHDLKTKTLVVCIDAEGVQRDDPEMRRGLHLGNLYEVENIMPSDAIGGLSEEKEGERGTGYLVCMYNLGTEPAENTINWYSTSRFALASEYQTVINLYQDLINNPPENKGHA